MSLRYDFLACEPDILISPSPVDEFRKKRVNRMFKPTMFGAYFSKPGKANTIKVEETLLWLFQENSQEAGGVRHISFTKFVP